MQASKDQKFTVYASGRCESAGNIILAGAHKKVAFKNCVFMFHAMTVTDGNGNRLKDRETEGNKKLGFFQKMFEESYPKIKVDKEPENEKYMSAQEMFIEKLIDEII